MIDTRILAFLVLLETGCTGPHLVSSGHTWKPGFDGLDVAYSRGPQWCYPGTSTDAQFLLWKLQHQEGSRAEQEASGATPQDAIDVPGQVDIVHDEGVCQRVSAVLDSLLFEEPRGQTVLVLTLPTNSERFVGRYAVIPLPLQLGEYSPLLEMTSDLQLFAGVHLY